MSSSGKTPLVLLHGWGMTPAVWQPLIAALAALDIDPANLYAPALPGHTGEDHRENSPPLEGKAAKTAGGGRGAQSTAAAHTIAFAQPDHPGCLRSRPSNGGEFSVPMQPSAEGEFSVPTLPPAAVVVGWSLGALLALELARIQPENVARLVLIGATPRFVSGPDWLHGLAPETVTAFVSGYARQPVATLRRFLALQTLGDAARRRLLPQLEAACVPHPADAPLPALTAGLQTLGDADLRPHLAAIKQPVHLIHGDGDALMPLAAARSLADTLPHARLNILENCGHAPLLSRPADCAALIREQLDAQEAARA